jgi:hypothetical protein
MKIAFLSACLACAGLGGKLQASAGHLQDTSQESEQLWNIFVNLETEDHASLQKRLANLLLVLHPAVSTGRSASTPGYQPTIPWRHDPHAVSMRLQRFWADQRVGIAEKEGSTEDLGHEAVGLVGNVRVVFKQGNVTKETMAIAGQPIGDVATQAAQYIKFKCRKGQCGTCEVRINGAWVRSCVNTIPPVSPGETYEINVRESMVAPSKKSSRFFSPKSIVSGLKNNLAGMYGFARGRRNAGDNWKSRLSEEEKIAAMVAERKAAKARKLEEKLAGGKKFKVTEEKTMQNS